LRYGPHSNRRASFRARGYGDNSLN
jgi:hypothetical protein